MNLLPRKIIPLLCAVFLMPATGICYLANADFFTEQAAGKEAKGDIAGAIEDYQTAYGNYSSELKYTDPDSAADWQKKMAVLNEKLAGLRRTYAQTLEKKGDFRNAETQFREAMYEKPDYALNYYDSARLSFAHHDLTDAMGFSTRAIQLQPDYAEAYALRGSAKALAVKLAALRRSRLAGGMTIWEGIVSIGMTEAKVEHVDMDGALADLTKAIELKPETAQYYEWRGLVKFQKGDAQGAVDDFTKAIAQKPDFSTAYNNRGHLRFIAGDAQGAAADLDKAIALDGNFATAYGNRAAVKQYAGDFDGALADSDKAIALKPDYLRAVNFRGALRSVMGNTEGAAADFKNAAGLAERIQMNESNLDITYNDPELIPATDSPDAALADMEESVTAPVKDAKWNAAFAQAYFARTKQQPWWGDEAGRLADFDRAIALKPDFGEAYKKRGLERLTRSYNMDPPPGMEERYGEETDPLRDVPQPDAATAKAERDKARKDYLAVAKADMERALQLLPGDAEIHAGLGSIKKQAGDNAGALAEFDKAVELVPATPDNYFSRSHVKKEMGDAKGAEKDMMRALELQLQTAKSPAEISQTYSQRADVEAEAGGTKAALADLDQAVAAGPTNGGIYYSRAKFKHDHGMKEGVMADLDKAIAMGPGGMIPAHYLRGQIKRDAGDLSGALEDFKNSTGMEPPASEARRETAVILQKQGDGNGAEDMFMKAVDYPLGSALAFAASDKRKAEIPALLAELQVTFDKAAVFKGTALERLPENVVAKRMQQPWQPAAELLKRYTTLIEMKPDLGALHCMRGYLRYNTGDFKGAAADFEKTTALQHGGDAPKGRTPLFLWLSRARTGDRKKGDAELLAWLKGREAAGGKDEWLTQIARFLTGGMTAQELVTKATALDGETNSIQRCEAFFYTGTMELLNGEETEGKDDLNRAVNTQERGRLEYHAAIASLKPPVTGGE